MSPSHSSQDDRDTVEEDIAWANREAISSITRALTAVRNTTKHITSAIRNDPDARWDSPAPTQQRVTTELAALLRNALEDVTLLHETLKKAEVHARTTAMPEVLEEGRLVYVLWREKYTLNKGDWRNPRTGTGVWVEVERHRNPQILKSRWRRIQGSKKILKEGQHPCDGDSVH